ncbi:Pol polyprotein [Plakobranchus ocellatus]|uniref:Pol polyprotein n=1 Tax=Plakobranchus ocellatus TaxID=259542 RepID=A0AAV4BAB8_9GAST|nr:Pol polyprotein [Plakobranchus ocellatus]
MATMEDMSRKRTYWDIEAKIEAGIIKNEPDGSGARSSDSGAKHPKLPNFQDGRDDLDISLTRFERFAESNGWSREKWSSSLCALLTGRALDCYGRHSAEQAKDYDKKLLCGMDNVVDYIDDLLVHTEIWEAHVKTLSELFKRLQEANFTVRPVKCLLGSRTVDFLGHSLGRGAIGLQDENVEKVRDAPRPQTKKEVRAFLGLVGYYKEFVPNFAAVSAPL